jgi:hypothetical protein
MRKILLPVLFLLVLTACHLPRQTVNPSPLPNDILQTSVAATLSALDVSQTPLPTPTLAQQFTPTPFPTMTPAFTNTPLMTNTPEAGFGSISGAIVYPFGGSPRFTVVAYEQNPPYHYWYWVTAPGDSYYSMSGYVSTGRYQVVAYSSDGPRGGCTTIVEVKRNETSVCDITDWAGSYRDKPAGVP